MSVYILGDRIVFPPVEYADHNGILAIGGDLKVERLLLAYRSGIFPWFSEGDPVIWHSPDPRFVMFPNELVVSKSMYKVLREKRFDITINKCFLDVIKNCQLIRRKGQDGTWITEEMIDAYVKLHEAGVAHSVEAWLKGKLVGGLYGLIIGSCFFGESMFAKESNASKAAFIHMVKSAPFSIIDCQVYTSHLASLGAISISRSRYLELLNKSLKDTEVKMQINIPD